MIDSSEQRFTKCHVTTVITVPPRTADRHRVSVRVPRRRPIILSLSLLFWHATAVFLSVSSDIEKMAFA